MMPHMQSAMGDPDFVERLAKNNDPDWLAGCIPDDGFFALCSIAARGYWIQINGHWHKRKDAIG